MPVTTLETWGNVNLTPEQHTAINNFLGNLQAFGHMTSTVGILGNTVDAQGNVITSNVSFTFDTVESANEYLAFISYLNPVSAVIVSQ